MRLIPLFLLLSACAQPYEWRHASHSDHAQFDKDRAQCEYEAAASVASYIGVVDRAARRNEVGVLCMRAKGYSQHPLAQ